jgi:hypothetical protein
MDTGEEGDTETACQSEDGAELDTRPQASSPGVVDLKVMTRPDNVMATGVATKAPD